MKLEKTTIVIWTNPEYDDPRLCEIQDLAHEAYWWRGGWTGSAYCSVKHTEVIEDPSKDPDWDGTEFFLDGWVP